ncbi:MAG: hypothetical protein NVSMB56_01000 [Pyrinomonadaceae bacterium]
MAMSKNDAVAKAKADLSKRLGIAENEISEDSVEEADFPDAALGAPVGDEMSAQMITSGWRIRLSAQGKSYEYRASKKEIRVSNFKGKNYRV